MFGKLDIRTSRTLKLQSWRHFVFSDCLVFADGPTDLLDDWMSTDCHVVVDGRMRCQEWLERAQLERCASAPRTLLVISVACLRVTDLNYAYRQCKLATKAPSTRLRHHTVLSASGARVMLSRQQSTSPLLLDDNKRFRLYAP
ncbi:hypothetical protein PENSPDRAFT_343121 [Peniophora sp. CONT]|nr:hypothetical protein PENSPDRAFT_343121 [Peniophora sp. CONT]